MNKSSFTRAWRHRPNTRSSASERRKLKKQYRRRARRTDGIPRYSERDVI
jgi:hypothetical protein